jgi:hypothetical protein
MAEAMPATARSSSEAGGAAKNTGLQTNLFSVQLTLAGNERRLRDAGWTVVQDDVVQPPVRTRAAVAAKDD